MLRKLVLLLALLAAWNGARGQAFRFVILGDRTGEAEPGVFEEVWKEAVAEKPAFVVTTGDSIQGLNDATADGEWLAFERMVRPYRQIPLYLTPGNHDIWSEASERLYLKHSGHRLHYSFDYRQVHFTILDNSRSDAFAPEELKFLEGDLAGHAAQPVKFIISHRPSWLLQVALDNPEFALQALAKKYGVKYVMAGHVHQLLHADLDGVGYLSMPSSGGHLRLSKKYEDGWFFGYAVVEVTGNEAAFQIKELKPPHGEGRVTMLNDWGKVGLVRR